MTEVEAVRILSRYLPSPSEILSHDCSCCHNAVHWLHGLDCAYSYRNGEWQEPFWIRDRYRWGPMHWPIKWCEIPEMDVLDCGAMSAFALRLFSMRGEQTVPVQVIMRYSTDMTEHWEKMWLQAGIEPSWIYGPFCYHEVSGVVREGRLVLWDPVEGRWLQPEGHPENLGIVIAMRCYAPWLDRDTVNWEGMKVPVGRWVMVSEYEAEGYSQI